jgi:hypothetical protein
MHGRAAWTTGRRLDEVLGEQDAGLRQPVQIRRAHSGMTQARQAIRSQLIGRNEQEVSYLAHHQPLSAAGRCAEKPKVLPTGTGVFCK